MSCTVSWHDPSRPSGSRMPCSARDLQSTIADRDRGEWEVGRGGMATVYLANDVQHGRRVALTLLAAELGVVWQRGDATPTLRAFQIRDALCQQLWCDGVDPRMVGEAMLHLDNDRVSDTPVVFLTRWCLDPEDLPGLPLANALSGARCQSYDGDRLPHERERARLSGRLPCSRAAISRRPWRPRRRRRRRTVDSGGGRG